MKICVICSGASSEKGISINSAKSIYEILEYYYNSVDIIFIDEKFEFYALPKEFIFANTVEDFLHLYKQQDIILNYISHLKTYDKIFLATHGRFGEDGYLQKILDDNFITYVGPSYYTAINSFYKHTALSLIWKHNICHSWTSEIFKSELQVKALLHKHGRLCVKPNDGGSSIGVSICNSSDHVMKAIKELQEQNYTPLLEEVHEGREFSITIIRGYVFDAIEIINEGVFTYEKKYFPSSAVTYASPARFPKGILEKIKQNSKQIYELFKCKDFLRLDGFYLPKENKVIYTDLNTIPGFQLNGLFFKNKCHFKIISLLLNIPERKNLLTSKKQNVFLLFGGDSSEQNVSIISGSNALFNLKKHENYNVTPFLLLKGKYYMLTYEESFQNSISDFKYIGRNKKPISLKSFIELSIQQQSIVFLALHGGIGENGYLQRVFEKHKVKYTGSNSSISALCMNKYKTHVLLQKHFQNHKNVYIIYQILLKNFSHIKQEELKSIWQGRMFIKPNDDGCSVGAMILNSLQDLYDYQLALQNNEALFRGVVMSSKSQDYLISEYVEVDAINLHQRVIDYKPKTHWIEGTVGVLNNKVFKASICVTNKGLLTMEEKFLFGSGTNLTPIPEQIMSSKDNLIIKRVIKSLIKTLNLNTYGRIDFFYNVRMQKIAFIEINTLPALTPATVLFQQAIQDNITPKLLMKKIVSLGKG